MSEPETNPLARQYFTDLGNNGPADTDENLRAWLWFTCPARLRDQVQQAIEQLREKERP